VREKALTELRKARKSNLVPGGHLPQDELTMQAQTIAGCQTQQHLLAKEDETVGGLLDELRGEGHTHLAEVVALRPGGGPPLLVLGVRYFFQRELLRADELRNALTMQEVEGLTGAQQAGFETLDVALKEHGATLSRLETVALETRRNVLEVKDSLERQGEATQELLRALMREMQELKQQLQE